MSVTTPFNSSAGDRRNGAPAGPATVAGPPPSATGDRLPRPPRRRRPGFAALAVLLIVGAAATAGLLAIRLDERVPVLVARNTIPAGKQITRADLAQVRVASSDVSLIAADRAGSVLGKYATQTIPGGRLIDEAMLGGSGFLTPGRVALGIVIKPGNAPAAGLRTGDTVKVYRAVDGAGTLLTDNATVAGVSSEERSGGLGGGGGGDTAVTIVVDDDGNSQLSAKIGAASLAGQIVLGLAERGDVVDS
jgi:hypothetical protein